MAYTKDDPEDQQRVAAFQEGLKQSGWIEGRNIQSDYRWYAGDVDRARSAAKELVELKPDLILVGASSGLVALRRETRSIPLIFVAVTDPVGLGLVESLARPGETLRASHFSNSRSVPSSWSRSDKSRRT
jgi:putative ABC transport system substrate-binding protein